MFKARKDYHYLDDLTHAPVIKTRAHLRLVAFHDNDFVETTPTPHRQHLRIITAGYDLEHVQRTRVTSADVEFAKKFAQENDTEWRIDQRTGTLLPLNQIDDIIVKLRADAARVDIEQTNYKRPMPIPGLNA